MQEPIPISKLKGSIERAKKLHENAEAPEWSWSQEGPELVLNAEEHILIQARGWGLYTGSRGMSNEKAYEKQGFNMQAACIGRNLLPAMIETLERAVEEVEDGLTERDMTWNVGTLYQHTVAYPLASAFVSAFPDTEKDEKA